MSTHNANRFDDSWQSGSADIRAEHDAPEESVHLLRAELDACREEIASLRYLLDEERRQSRGLRGALAAINRHIDLIGHQP